MTKLIDETIFETETVRVGRFRCPVGYGAFAECGRPNGHLVVFPRTSVWIQPSGAPAFVADPSVATLHNPGQEYSRRPLASDGDRSDWLASLPRSLARLRPTRTSMRTSPGPSRAPSLQPMCSCTPGSDRCTSDSARGSSNHWTLKSVIAIVADVVGGLGHRSPAKPRAREEDGIQQIDVVPIRASSCTVTPTHLPDRFAIFLARASEITRRVVKRCDV